MQNARGARDALRCDDEAGTRAAAAAAAAAGPGSGAKDQSGCARGSHWCRRRGICYHPSLSSCDDCLTRAFASSRPETHACVRLPLSNIISFFPSFCPLIILQQICFIFLPPFSLLDSAPSPRRQSEGESDASFSRSLPNSSHPSLTACLVICVM